MAPKTHSLSHRPPQEEEQERESSSGEEEEENSSDDETEDGSSEEEEEDRQTLSNKKPPIEVPKSEPKPIPEESESDSEAESEGGSLSSYKLQPIRKPSASSAKRSREGGDLSPVPAKNSKKSKPEEKKSSSTPGGCITRLWSNEDEIAVLNGMIEFRKTEGQDPNSERFYNFIKGKLQADFSKDQLRTKISRLKKRFVNAMKKSDGADPVFSKPHEDMAFELSKTIWGNAVNNRAGSSVSVKTETAKKSGSVKTETAKKDVVKPEKVAVEEETAVDDKDGEERDFWSKYRFLSLSFNDVARNFPSLAMSPDGTSLLKEKVSLIDEAKAKEFDDKWRQVMVDQTELNHKILTLMTEQVRMALNQ